MNARAFAATLTSHPNAVADRDALLANWKRIAAYHRKNGNRIAELEALAAIAKLEAQ